MKKTYILFSILFITYSTIIAQKEKKELAKVNEWTDSTAFAEGPDPIMKEFGPLSDSLSEVYYGKDIFIANNQYYIINTVADYYLWFIDRYPQLFKGSPTQYYESYENQYGFGMYSFVIKNYQGKHLPLTFDRSVLVYDEKDANRLSDQNDKYKREKEESWRRWQQDQLRVKKAMSKSPANAPAPKVAPQPNKAGSN